MSEVLWDLPPPPDPTLDDMFGRIIMTDGYVERGITRAIAVIGTYEPGTLRNAQVIYRADTQLGSAATEITSLHGEELAKTDFAALAESDPAVGLAGEILRRPIGEHPSLGHRIITKSSLAVQALFQRRPKRTSDTPNLADDIDLAIEGLTRRRRIVETALGGLVGVVSVSSLLYLSNGVSGDNPTLPTGHGPLPTKYEEAPGQTNNRSQEPINSPGKASWAMIGGASGTVGGAMVIMSWPITGLLKRRMAYDLAKNKKDAADEET